MVGNRSRTEMRTRQGSCQFDFDEGRRRRIFAAGKAVQALWRGYHRDGIRRAGPGRYLRAQD